jgi:hypothetical protein
MLNNWLQRAAGYRQHDEPTAEELIPEAVRARRCGVVVDPLSYLALSDNEREALSLADAAILLAADEDTWAERAVEEIAEVKRASA